jgi:hypothetical protein
MLLLQQRRCNGIKKEEKNQAVTGPDVLKDLHLPGFFPLPGPLADLIVPAAIGRAESPGFVFGRRELSSRSLTDAERPRFAAPCTASVQKSDAEAANQPYEK